MRVRVISPQSLVLLVFLVTCTFSFSYAAQEIPIGRVNGLRQQIQIRFSDCERNWVIDQFQASCLVKIFEIENPYLIYPMQSFVSWKYDSGESWGIHVTAQRTAMGYTITLNGRGAVPQDRLKFGTAHKFIRDAFEKGSLDSTLIRSNNKDEYQYVLMTHVIGTAFNEAHDNLTTMSIVDRELPYRSNRVMQKCIDKRFRFQGKMVCMIHMARYNEGEVILSDANTVSSAVSHDGSKKLTIYLKSLPAWKNLLGASSLSYLRVEYEGEYKEDDFKSLYRQASARIENSEFLVRVLRPTGIAREDALYSEQNKGFARLLRREFAWNEGDCRQSWVVESFKARCRNQITWSSYRIGESTNLLFHQTELSGVMSTLVVYSLNSAYEMQLYAAQEVVSDFTRAKAFISKSLAEQPRGMIYESALGVE